MTLKQIYFIVKSNIENYLTFLITCNYLYMNKLL